MRDAKPTAELRRREPVMVVRRARILLRPDQFLQRRVLGWVSSEHEHHSLHVKIGRNSADRELRLGQGMPLASQHDPLAVGNRRDNLIRRAD